MLEELSRQNLTADEWLGLPFGVFPHSSLEIRIQFASLKNLPALIPGQAP